MKKLAKLLFIPSILFISNCQQPAQNIEATPTPNSSPISTTWTADAVTAFKASCESGLKSSPDSQSSINISGVCECSITEIQKKYPNPLALSALTDSQKKDVTDIGTACTLKNIKK